MEQKRQTAQTDASARKWVMALTMIVGLGAITLIIIASKPGKLQDSRSKARLGDVNKITSGSRFTHSSLSAAPWHPDEIFTETEPSVDVAELIRRLSEINPGALTGETADQWHHDLLKLIGQGTSAVPALEDFFLKNQDVIFDTGTGTNLLGEPTLRVALMKAVFDLPTPENVNLQEKLLQTTVDPDEIALLARQLQAQEPWKHKELIVQAAQAALDRIKGGQPPGRDSKALIEVLEYHGVPGANIFTKSPNRR